MAPIAVLLDTRSAHAAFRRSLPADAPPLLRVASADALLKLLARRCLEAAVLAPSRVEPVALQALLQRWPAFPVTLHAPFRPDDGATLLMWRRLGVAAICVGGVDDPIAGDLVTRHTLSARRVAAFDAARRALRAETPLQIAVWRRLLADAEHPPTTAALAKEVGVTREYLSRDFAAGDAPNLKRAIDAARVMAAAQLLANPVCGVDDAARLLHFAGASHLRTTVRRVAGVTAGALGALGPQGVLAAFVRGRMRSRI